jgi:hypothetical protein
LWARAVHALPWPWFLSKRARYVWPAGLVRNKRAAASENAHVRDAFPSFVPDVPERYPADSQAHFTKRPLDTNAGARGKRWG